MSSGAVATAPASGQWDCRSYNIPAYVDQILSEREEALSTSFGVAHLSLPGTSPSHTSDDYLATAHSSGQVRLYRVKDTMMQWISRKASGSSCIAWQAHEGPVYSLHCVSGADGSPALLVTGGDDGCVKAWRVSDMRHALTASSSGQPVPQLQPCWSSQVPRVDCVWGSTGLCPGVVCMTVDRHGAGAGLGRLCVGASDGGVHIYDLEGASSSSSSASSSVAASTTAAGRTSAVAGAAYAQPLHSLAGHAAGVLSMDVSCAGQLASGSEDGTVRLWDCRQANPCTCAINPWDGVTLPLSSPAQVLQCVRGPYVSSVKFATEGGWLLMGTGNRALTLWSISLGALAKQQSTPMVPQAAAFVPGEILVAGSAPSLLRFRFSALDMEPSVHPLQTRSVYGMDVHPASGAIALCGSCGLDLLSPHGAQMGAVWSRAPED